MQATRQLLGLLITIAFANAQQCNLPGICVGNELDVTVADTAEKCLAFCQDTDGCNWYSHDADNDFCFAFSNCPERDTSCTTCTSGQKACHPLQCFVTGKCQGKLLEHAEARSQEECLSICQETANSTWFTYHVTDHLCMILDDCELEQADGFFVSGERNCTVQPPDFSRIFVQHGTNTTWMNMPTSRYRSEGTSSRCSPLPDYPIDIKAGLGTIVDGELVVCGGRTETANFTASCYRLNRELNLWMEFESLPGPRARSSSVTKGDQWWIAGGRNSTHRLSSSVVYNITTGTWRPGPSLPSARDTHCLVQINHAAFLLVGGFDGTEQLNDTWIYTRPDDAWTEAPDMPTVLSDMACGLYTDRAGIKHVLLAGGNVAPHTQVLSFNLDTMAWSTLPDLPSAAMSWPALVQDEEDIFLVNPTHDNVMIFDQDDLTFSIVSGQGTGVRGDWASVVALNDENLHGCKAFSVG